VAPGDDNIRHMTEANYIINNGTFIAHAGSFDPPLFHILLASLSLISGLSIDLTTKIFAPLLAILSTLSIYFVSRRLFGSRYLSLIILALLIFLSPQPYQIYNDGTYLNLFGAGFLLIFSLSFLPPLLENDKINLKTILPFFIFSAALLLSHSLSATYFILILAVYTIILLFKYRKLLFKKPNYLTALFFLGVLILPFTWKFYLNDSFQKILSTFGLRQISSTNILSLDFSTINSIPNFDTYKWLLNYLPIILATFGLLFLFKIFKGKTHENWLIISWFTALFIGSRVNFFQLPERFARDMAVVVTILSGVFIYKLFRENNRIYKFVIIVIFSMLVILYVPAKTNTATQYDSMVRVQSSDEKAMRWIKENTQPDAIIMGMPRTIVAGDWGSYINIITGRTTIDGTLCPEEDRACDHLYNPLSTNSIKYYLVNKIDYIYDGKPMVGSFISKNTIDWSYKDGFKKTPFLQKVSEFPESKLLGSVVIYKIDRDKLTALIEE
jgi:hypothetical protein